jgi:hypothetical protein
MRNLCKTCWDRHGKSLWEGCCLCSNSIAVPFICPGILRYNPDPIPTNRTPKSFSKAGKTKSKAFAYK